MNSVAKFGRTRALKIAKWSFQAIVLALVVWGIWHTTAQSLDKFEAKKFSLTDLRPEWLVASAVIYLAGSITPWWFWHRVLVAMGQRPSYYASLRAFYIGHLGKYVPGKAMVVVLRAGLVRGPRVDTAVAATAVFVETLTTMAVGAILAAVILAVEFHEQRELLFVAVGMAFAAGIPALPPVFRRIVAMLRVQRASAALSSGLDGLRWPLMMSGWVTLALSWLVLGLSLWAALMSLPERPEGLADMLASLPLLTLCVAFALVAGFVSLVPAGAGVREAVVIAVLVPAYGEIAALVAAILLRLVWLVAEVLVSIILYAIRPAAEPDAPTAGPPAETAG